MDYKIYLVDVDGTLYSKRKMHIKMLLRLLKTVVVNPFKIKELLWIWKFRKMRELDIYRTLSVSALCDRLAHEKNVEVHNVETVVLKWMFTVPLEVIEKCARRNLLAMLKSEKMKGAKIYIYSDYPADEKIQALGMDYVDGVFCADMPEIAEQKPSAKAMKYILDMINTGSENILYIGDRYDKDGKSAELAGIEYVDVHMLMRQLKRGYLVS